MEIVSLAEAARLTVKSRNTLKSHLNSGKLSGSKNENGDWEIQVSELIRVYKELPGAKGSEQVKVDQHGQSRPSKDYTGLIAENATLKERLEQQTKAHSSEKHSYEDQLSFLKDQIAMKDKQMLTLTAQIEDHRERRSKTEDAAADKEKAAGELIKQYQSKLGDSRRQLKAMERRHRAELEEARKSSGWLGLIRSLIGSTTNPEELAGKKESKVSSGGIAAESAKTPL